MGQCECADLPADAHALRELLEKARDLDQDAICAEAQQRLLDLQAQPGKIEELQNIYDLMTDGSHFHYALNELRGKFFEALLAEFAHLLAKNQLAAEGDDGGDLVTQGMEKLLRELGGIADTLLKACAEDAANIPKVLGSVLQNAC